MIAHVVLFEPRPGLARVDQLAILDALTAAASEIPSIRRFRIGRRIRHGLPGYEQAMRQNYEFVVLIEVDDLEALKKYLSHPSHAAAGRHFMQSATAALAYDFTIFEGGKLEALVDV